MISTKLRLVVLSGALVLAAPARAAAPYKTALTNAANSLEDALKMVKRAGSECRQAIAGNLGRAIRELDGSRAGASDEWLKGIKLTLGGLAGASPVANCPPKVADRLTRAIGFVESARVAQGGGDDQDEGFRRHRDRDRGWDEEAEARRRARERDDEDGRRHDDRHAERDRDRDSEREREREREEERENEEQARRQPVSPNGPAVELSMARIAHDVVVAPDGARGVQLTVPQVILRGMRGKRVSFASAVRAQNGPGGAWVTSDQSTVPNDAYRWVNPYSYGIRYDSLKPMDTAGGRFSARIALADAAGAHLSFLDVPFELRAAPPPPPPPVPVARDCGTGQDPGCTLSRGGGYAMDAITFQGLITAMRANRGDLIRRDTATSILAHNYLTAIQLGLILDLFSSDLLKLDVAKVAAPRVVNPSHALGLVVKFRSSLLQRDYTTLISAQR
jgi:hypothetical protein